MKNKKHFLFTALFFIASSCAIADERLLAVVEWRNDGYAKDNCKLTYRNLNPSATNISTIDCQNSSGCKEDEKTVGPCETDPMPAYRQFEHDLLSQLATNKKCISLKVTRQWGMPEIHSELRFSFVPGMKKQEWHLFQMPSRTFTIGSGSSIEIAKEVCDIVNGKS